MPTSATGSRRDPSAGYTLVETLATLLVLSLVAGLAMLAAPGPDSTVRSVALQLAARMEAASAESVTINRRIALVVTPEGYGFERLEAGGRWSPLRGRSAFAYSPWPPGVAPDIAEQEAGAPWRAAEFDPVTGAEPARLRLSGERTSWVVGVDGEGEVDVRALDR